MMYSITEYSSALQIPALFEKYEHDYNEYIENSEDGLSNIIDMIENVLHANEDDLRRRHEDEIQDIYEVSNLYDEIETLERDLVSDLLPNTDVDHDFNVEMDWRYWEQKVKENNEKTETYPSEFEGYDEDYYKEIRHESRSESNAIDDLFSKT